MASETPTISMKLLIDQESNVVLLAEAGNDFVDSLHSLLKLPLGNIARPADKHQSLQPGCLNNLYNSVENLGLKCFRTEACKRMLRCPRNVYDVEFKKLKLNMDLTGLTGYFVCGILQCNEKQGGLFSYYNTPECSCGKLMNVQATKLQESVAVKDETEGVLFKEESMFFITDDLRVGQSFPGELVQFLHNLGFKNASRIEEKVIEIGSKEMTDLLIHSFISKTTLTDVFLRKQGTRHSTLMFDEQFSFMAAIEKKSTVTEGKISVKAMLRKSDRNIVLVEDKATYAYMLQSEILNAVVKAIQATGLLKCLMKFSSYSSEALEHLHSDSSIALPTRELITAA
ncbi:hypothetical protein V6N13_121906 [Hibiscus sabdariffa]